MEAGGGGLIYLTPDAYEQGTQATEALAIDGKPIDLVALVPSSLFMPTPHIHIVLPIYDPVTGKLHRKGGGVEVRVPGPVNAPDIRWFALCPP